MTKWIYSKKIRRKLGLCIHYAHIVHTILLIFWNLHGVCLINYFVPNSWCKYKARCSPSDLNF